MLITMHLTQNDLNPSFFYQTCIVHTSLLPYLTYAFCMFQNTNSLLDINLVTPMPLCQ